ncbi:UBE2J2 [Symbiodinium pilosum]|uniref:UBE2J2 protein n=1 Tax=Symbiodinium pilosum TaxID=2952 RepID=A0A812IQM2_SYMPI|nr:UBE2J2 [Symbiodinium pilosum]
MTDCRGLSEDEAKMLLELELLAAGATFASMSKASPVREDPQEHNRFRRNLGSRMRAVKEEEESPRTTSFNIEVEYEADWTQDEVEGSGSRWSETVRPNFCGSSDVSTATSSGALPEDLHEGLEAEDEEAHFCQQEPAGPRVRRSRRGSHVSQEEGLHREIPGNKKTVQQPALQPAIRILVRSTAAEPIPCEEDTPAKKSMGHAQEEDPWVSGLDPWAAAKLPRASMQKGQGRSAAKGRRRGNGRD